jgi:Secretion system C-terminal sorting domain
MKKLFTLLTLLATTSHAFAATYVSYLGYSLSGSTYTIWINSDTVPGETAVAEIKYNGSTYTGLVNGSFGTFTRSGVSGNWSVVITLPSGASSPEVQVAVKNQSGSPYAFSGFSSFSGTTLSTEMLTFSAVKTPKATVVSWQMATEQDNALFQIERSTNATDFLPIGEVKSAGSSKTTKVYSFTDAAPMRGINYYRLQAVDITGKTTTSKIIAVNSSDKNGDKLAVFPNPAGDILRLDMTASETSTTAVNITDLTGRVVLTQKIAVNEGANLVQMTVSSLNSGVYFVRLNDSIVRFVKQ